jgi:hypothetical protein
VGVCGKPGRVTLSQQRRRGMKNLSLRSGYNSRLTDLLCFAVLVVGILIRFLYLDADPQYSEWVGFVTDEGRWVRHGRSLALYGNLADGRDLHLFLAPLFQLSNFLVFELFGVKIWAARMLAATSGSAILILFWGSLRRVITPQALLLGLTLLALQVDLVIFSRLAVPEMALMSCQLAIYFMIVSNEGSARRLAAAGVLLALAVAVKLTMLLTVPIYFSMILALPRTLPGGMGRWRDVKLFGVSLAAPLLSAALVGYFYLDNTPALGSAVESLSTAATFLGFSRPYVMVNFLFDHALSLTFILCALGLWLSALGWVAGYPDEIDFLSHRYLATSAIWIALYFSLMTTLEYFPARYKIHILIPMAVFISVGMSLVQQRGIQKLIEFISGAKGAAGLLWIGAATLPTAAICTPIMLLALELAGLDPARLTTKMTSLSLALIGSVCVLLKFRYCAEAVRFFLTFPLIGGIGWGLVLALSSSSFRPLAGFPSQIALLSIIMVVASAILFLLGSIWNWWRSSRGAQLIPLCAIFYLTISLAEIAPGYLQSHYTMRNASRDLGGLLSGSRVIASIGADGLFNGNDLPYESLTAPEFNELGEKPEFVAVAFYNKWVKATLNRHYHVTKTYDLYNYPAPEGWGVHPQSFEPIAIPVTLYEKNDASPE